MQGQDPKREISLKQAPSLENERKTRERDAFERENMMGRLIIN